MPNRDLDALQDILVAARLIQKFVTEITKESFLDDDLRYSAVIRHIEVIGEAAKRVSSEFKAQYPKIKWRSMIGMRNILIHAYDEVDLEEVWETAVVSIPELMVNVLGILSHYESLD